MNIKKLKKLIKDLIYIPETTYNGTVYSTELTAEDFGLDEDEWDEMNTNPKVLVLYPVN